MMNRKFAHGCRCLSALLLLACVSPATAAPPAPEQLLPAGTTEFVAIPDISKLADNWQQTFIFKLLHDPNMQPFLSDLQKNSGGFNYLFDTIGIEFDSFKAAAGGELGWAVVLVNRTEVAHVLTLDMTGRDDAARKLLGEMAQRLGKLSQKYERRKLIGGMEAIVVDLPENRQIIYGLKDGLLVVTDHLPTLQGMLQRWVDKAQNRLDNVPAFQSVRRKSRVRDGEKELIRFYFEPIARTEAIMIYFPEMKKVKGDNIVQALRKEGVDGIKGVGGTIAFQSNGTDMLFRIAAHAPQPFRGALRMARLPNETPLNPDAWVPADLSAYITVGLDLVNAFDCFDTLFERLVDEPPGEFKKIMDSVANAKDGPGVNIRDDILAHLQNRVTIINDATAPFNETSERYLVAIPARSALAERILTESIRKCFEPDRRIKARHFNGACIWEYQAKQKKPGKDGKVQVNLVPSTCFAVARGHVFVSTHGSLLDKVLMQNGPGLGQAADYQHLMKEMTRLGMSASSSRSFVRLDVGVEPTYEMMRGNRVEQANSIYGLILSKLLKDETTQKMRADGTKLPLYPQVKKHLGLVGSYTTTDADGWSVVGVVLKK